ncbi:MAG: HAMP domain-containing sensor histidine kinase [Pirellulales bacterium]
MRWLPPLPEPLQKVVLPMADRSAAALIDAILHGDTPANRQRLTEALESDPSLALWAVVHVASDGNEAPTASDLSGLWLQRIHEHLIWPQQGPFDVPATTAQEYAKLAARHVALARAAAVSAGSSPHRGQAYLASLLSHAAQWIELGGGSAGNDMKRLIPAWITTSQTAESAGAELGTEAGAVDQAAYSWNVESLPFVHILPELARRLHRLSQLENDFDAVLEDAKLKALYTLAAGAGHEINNPLGSIAGRAQLLIRDEDDADRRRTLAKINSQAFRAHEMISDMMLFAKPPEPVREPVDLGRIAKDVVEGLREAAEQRNTALDQKGPDEPVILEADRTQISVALRAMCLNAIEALGGGGRVEVRIGWSGEGAARAAEIVVFDNGPGIAPHQLEHIFDPFYSGREAGRGLGFGLSKSWRIIKNHGGKIEVESEPGRGSSFKILLPAA